MLFKINSADPFGDTKPYNARLVENIRQILKQAELLLPKLADVTEEEIGDLVDKEMQQTTDAIEAAAAKIAVLYVYYISNCNAILVK